MTELHTPADGHETAVDPTDSAVDESAAAESIAAEPTVAGSIVAAEDFQPDVTSAPALITEQEVRFGTAAALSWPTAQPRPAGRKGRKHYPRRSASYYDTSLMSREGYRL